ncbi:hypothetical protein ACM66B_000801 [Microbotryomycetes sp. NB124-2]
MKLLTRQTPADVTALTVEIDLTSDPCGDRFSTFQPVQHHVTRHACATPLYDRFCTADEGSRNLAGTHADEVALDSAPPTPAMSSALSSGAASTTDSPTLDVPSTPATASTAVAPSSPAQATTSRVPLSDAAAQDELEDGPLFRALLSDNERRSKVLRTALKTFVRAGQDSLDSLKQASETQLALDLAAQALTTNNSTVLGGLYERELADRRTARADSLQAEIETLTQVLANMRDAIDRLKTVDKRRKDFESESKKYYDELGKYLSKAESDPSKSASFDSKQASRHTAFEQQRLQHFHFVEALVEGEEAAVALWLQQWVGLGEARATTSTLDKSLRESREQQRATVARTLGERMLESALNEQQDGADNSESDEDAASLSATSAGSALSGVVRRRSESRRKRRSSLPHFGSEPHEGSTGDRFKGFLNKTGQRISSATQQISSAAQQATQQLSSVAEQLSHVGTQGHQAQTDKSTALAAPINLEASGHTTQSARRKEGTLWCTKAGVAHSGSGDGGGAWTPHWCVLSEGQMVEFSGFKGLDVKNQPINLALASVRVSRNTDRRFAFEILTPSLRRMYQATSEEEMHSWVSAISAACESLLNGTSSVRQFDASKLTGTSRPYLLKDLVGSSFAHTHKPQSTASSLSANTDRSQSPVPTNGATPTSPRSSGKVSSGFKDFSNRLPPWIGAPLARRTSAGAARRESKTSFPSTSATTSKLASPAPESLVADSVNPSSFSATIISSSVRPTLQQSGSFQDWDSVDLQGVDTSPSFAATTGTGRQFDQDIAQAVSAMRDKSTTTTSQAQKAHNATRIQQLVRLEGNSRCAECAAADPRWASWSLGVFVCIRCSGIHRSLGTHLSKVRSIDLDDWNDEQLASMEAIGNVKANALWQARKPSDLVVNDSNVAEFIKAKYVEQRYKGV